MKHEMKLREIYFNKIKIGEKIYEIRLNDEKRQLINVGDFIIFKKEPLLEDVIETEVVELLHFKTFKEMASNILPKEIGFDNHSIDDIVKVYHQFYSTEDEKKFGVLAIKVKII